MARPNRPRHFWQPPSGFSGARRHFWRSAPHPFPQPWKHKRRSAGGVESYSDCDTGCHRGVVALARAAPSAGESNAKHDVPPLALVHFINRRCSSELPRDVIHCCGKPLATVILSEAKDFDRSVPQLECLVVRGSFSLGGKFGSGAWTRTRIASSKGWCPTN